MIYSKRIKNLGLNIIDVNRQLYRQLVATSKLSVFRASWIADYPDAENYLSLFYSKFITSGPIYTFSSDDFEIYMLNLFQTNDSVRYLIYFKWTK